MLKPARLAHSTLRRIFLVNLPIALLLLIPFTADAALTGHYRCWQYNVEGAGKSCGTLPGLTLEANGQYQAGSEKGTYSVNQNQINLSESKLRGVGTLQNGNQIVFNYQYNGWHHTVTYLCSDCDSGSGEPTANANLSNSSNPSIGVSLTLRFSKSDGALSWVNAMYLIPQGAAEAFAATGQVPTGGATALAYSSGELTVSARFRSVASNNRYAVFIGAAALRYSVATIEIPDAKGEIERTIDAVLIAASSDAAPSKSESSTAAPEQPAYIRQPQETQQPRPNINATVCNPNIPHYQQPGCIE